MQLPSNCQFNTVDKQVCFGIFSNFFTEMRLGLNLLKNVCLVRYVLKEVYLVRYHLQAHYLFTLEI